MLTRWARGIWACAATWPTPLSLLALMCLISAPGLWAEEAPPLAALSTPRRELREELGASVNTLGLQNSLDLSLRWPLSASPNALLSDAHVSLGISHALTPSYTRAGAWAELSPLSVLDLRVGVEPTVYFGTFHSLLSFDSYRDRFDSDTRNQRSGARFGTAGRFYVSPTLKMKAGPLVAVASATFEWWKSDAVGPFFYEPARDTLLRASGDSLVTTSSVLLWQRELESRGKLSAGLIHQLTYVYDAPANRVQRTGILMLREFGGKRFGLDRPSVVGVLSYYLDDPSKKHQLSAALAVTIKFTR